MAKKNWTSIKRYFGFKYLFLNRPAYKPEAKSKSVPKPLSTSVSFVVPTYNVAPYIDEFLNSIISQTTGLDNVEVLIVDDGSTDGTSDIAKRWRGDYPETIRYIWQENKGAAEARNTGLRHAKGDWVSFPDPDDILEPNWLAAFDEEIKRAHKHPLLAVTMPFKMFREATGRYYDHPLSRFYSKRVDATSHDQGDYFLQSAAKSFFCRKSIIESGITFDARIKPSSEDLHFINALFLAFPGRSVVRLPKPFYVYRKRAAETSQVDVAYKSALWCTDELRYSQLALSKIAYAKYGFVPRHVQRLVLYCLSWRLRAFVGHPSKIKHLTPAQFNEFKKILSECLKFIAPDVIMSMDVGALFEEQKLALLKNYKGISVGNRFLYVKQFDPYDGTVQFCELTGGSDKDTSIILQDGVELEKLHPSKSTSYLGDIPFFTEHRFWVRVRDGFISAIMHEQAATIKHQGRRLGEMVTIEQIKSVLRGKPAKSLSDDAQALRAYATSDEAVKRYSDCWVLMDRDHAADDNAEHLYRYMLRAHKVDKKYFVLRASSPDWKRLDAEGFRLLEFGSREHVAALVNSAILASSHLDDFILSPVVKDWIKDLIKYKFVFLQHGVTKDDQSSWFNKKPISLLVTAATEEWISVADKTSQYFLSDKEAKLTGFPRHDALLAKPQGRRSILIMPTWRKYLAGESQSIGISQSKSPEFATSEYLKFWQDVLTSSKLHYLAEEHGLEITFRPHPNMAIYLEDMSIPPYINCQLPGLSESIQETFAESAVLVTDYSSVAFDCAYIDKPIVYFQFDSAKMYDGNHVYAKGYFDYAQDGFGPVCQTVEDVFIAINAAINGDEDAIYQRRRAQFFAFKDGKCSERVYQEIQNIIQHNNCTLVTEEIAPPHYQRI